MTETLSYEEQKVQLSRDLRKFRRGANLTGIEAASKAGFSQSKISKIETSVLVPSPADVETLCGVYKLSKTDKRDLLERAEQLDNEVNDWRSYLRSSSKQAQENHNEHERKSKDIRVFQQSAIPGLLQTPDYAAAILRAFGYPDSVVESSLAARIERQAVIYDNAKKLSFVIMEAALRSPFGTAKVMTGQIDRLLTLVELPNIEISVVPLMTMLPAVPLNQFCMYDGELVTVETAAAEVLVHEKRDIDLYAETFNRLQSVALDANETKDLLQAILRDYESL